MFATRESSLHICIAATESASQCNIPMLECCNVCMYCNQLFVSVTTFLHARRIGLRRFVLRWSTMTGAWSSHGCGMSLILCTEHTLRSSFWSTDFLLSWHPHASSSGVNIANCQIYATNTYIQSNGLQLKLLGS